MSGVAQGRSRPSAGSSRRCWRRLGLRARRARRGCAGSPRLGSRAPSAGSGSGSRRPSPACPAAAADRSTSTSVRCQRRIVSGRTKTLLHRSRGSSRASAARSARSAGRQLGRPTWRRNTASSCRKTRISTSFAASDRQRNTTNPTRCRNSQYRQEMTTRRSCQHPAQRRRTEFRHHSPTNAKSCKPEGPQDLTARLFQLLLPLSSPHCAP
jgi:hypothetical protein